MGRKSHGAMVGGVKIVPNLELLIERATQRAGIMLDRSSKKIDRAIG
jgi:hypothetical protein